MADSGEDSITPIAGYRDDPKRQEKYLHIEVDIKGLKKTFTGKSATNADIILNLEERSLTLRVSLKTGNQTKKYLYFVKRLPASIVTDPKRSYYRIRRDTVDIFLEKSTPGRWDTILASKGLDQDV